MRVEAELFKALRMPIVVATLLLGASGLLAADAWSRLHQAEAAESAREASAADLQRNSNSLRSERQNAIAFGERFVALEASGAFEPNSRPLVIDRFEAATEPWRAQVKRFELGVAGDVALPGLAEPVLHKVRSAALTFDLMPRHEESFLAVAQAVRDAMPGLRSLERCEIGWIGEDSDESLKASCTLNLYRFERRAEPAGGTVVDANGSTLPGGLR